MSSLLWLYWHPFLRDGKWRNGERERGGACASVLPRVQHVPVAPRGQLYIWDNVWHTIVCVCVCVCVLW